MIDIAHFFFVAWLLLRSCVPGKENPSVFWKDLSIGSPSIGFPLYLDLNWVLGILILISIFILAYDFSYQAKQLEEANNRNPHEQASRSETR